MAEGEPEEAMGPGAQVTKTQSDFTSHGVRCSGDLYLPAGLEHPPVVVMAHGFASERCFRLPSYAERFAGAGMAVYLFDYRCFGKSPEFSSSGAARTAGRAPPRPQVGEQLPGRGRW